MWSYDTAGNILTVTDTSNISLATLNPLRYRGYVFDHETGLYYLQSRYYDPEIGRFLNADAFVSTGQGQLGNNMFAYCLNNPVNGCDSCGTCFHRWDFWNDCGRCRGLSSGERIYNFFVDASKVVNDAKSACNDVTSFLSEAGDKINKTAQSAYNNLEISAGVGLGLQGSFDILDGFSAGLGVSFNLLHASLVDGEFKLQQRFSQGKSLTLIVYDFFGYDEEYFAIADFSSPDTATIRDAVTIVGGEIYFYVGGSFSIGFDFASFFRDINEIFTH